MQVIRTSLLIMKLKIILLTLFIALLFSKSYGQIIKNVIAEQSGNTLIIYYSLLSDTPCEVTFSVSSDDGKTWINPTKGLTGDVGNYVSPGNLSIRWEVFDDQEELVSNHVKFKVAAQNVAAPISDAIVGIQVWSAVNLNVNRFRNGDIIPEARTSEEWRSAGDKRQPAWCYYGNDPQNGRQYGKLYNWYAVNDPRGLAPLGYHIPSEAEWTLLSNNLGGPEVAGGKLKSIQGWSKGGNGTDNYRFDARPGGFRDYYGGFDDIGYGGNWWSSSEYGTDDAWCRSLFFDYDDANRDNFNKHFGFSVRCIRD